MPAFTYRKVYVYQKRPNGPSFHHSSSIVVEVELRANITLWQRLQPIIAMVNTIGILHPRGTKRRHPRLLIIALVTFGSALAASTRKIDREWWGDEHCDGTSGAGVQEPGSHAKACGGCAPTNYITSVDIVPSTSLGVSLMLQYFVALRGSRPYRLGVEFFWTANQAFRRWGIRINPVWQHRQVSGTRRLPERASEQLPA